MIVFEETRECLETIHICVLVQCTQVDFQDAIAILIDSTLKTQELIGERFVWKTMWHSYTITSHVNMSASGVLSAYDIKDFEHKLPLSFVVTSTLEKAQWDARRAIRNNFLA